MSFWSRLANVATLGITGAIAPMWGQGDKKDKPLDVLNKKLDPLVQMQQDFAAYGFPAAKESFSLAGANYKDSLDFLHKLMNGSDEELMNLFNADEVTKSADESEAAAYSLGGRSGSRAAVLAGVNESRSADLNRMITQLRASSPSQIANIAQAIANMGSQQAGLATGTVGGASGILFQSEQFRQEEANRRSQMIASIIGTAFKAAGAAAGGV